MGTLGAEPPSPNRRPSPPAKMSTVTFGSSGSVRNSTTRRSCAESPLRRGNTVFEPVNRWSCTKPRLRSTASAEGVSFMWHPWQLFGSSA